jgi:hypothetical protein
MFKTLTPEEVKVLLAPYRLHGPFEKKEFDWAQEVILGEVVDFPSPLGTSSVVLEGPQNTLLLVDNNGRSHSYWVASFDSTERDIVHFLNRMELEL